MHHPIASAGIASASLFISLVGEYLLSYILVFIKFVVFAVVINSHFTISSPDCAC